MRGGVKKASAAKSTAKHIMAIVAEESVNYYFLRLAQEPVPGR